MLVHENNIQFLSFFPLNYSFRGTPWVGNKDLTVDKYAKDIPFLDKYALERWEVRVYVLIIVLFHLI